MLQTRLKKALVNTVLGVAVALGCAGGVQAKVYPGSFDPVFGGSLFTNLGWEGTAVFDDAGCSVPSSGLLTLAGCSGMKIKNITLTFYDALDPTDPTTRQTVNVGSISAKSIYFDADGDFVGGSGGFAPADAFDIPLYIVGGYDWYLSWVLPLDSFGKPTGEFSRVNLVYALAPNDGSCAADIIGIGNQSYCGVSAVPATFRPTSPIPEPSTYALMLAGLAAVGFVARRRRAS